MKKLMISVVAFAAMTVAGSAAAKLPPPSEEAKAKAAEAKDKAAWADKVSAYQLCMSQDKVVATHMKTKGGKPAAAQSACTNPGAYVPTAVATAGTSAPPATGAAMPAAAKPGPTAPAKK